MASCIKLRAIKKDTVSSCKKKKLKIEDVRIFCPEDITETISATTEAVNINGFVSNLVNPDVVGNPTPFVSIDVLNPDDLDELNEYAFDRTEDEGDDQYNFTPLKLKILDPEQQATLDSWKGQDLGLVYKIENKSGEFLWRRLYMKMVGITGGLLRGYELSFNSDNPDDSEKPMYILITDAETTEIALDVMTNFGS